MRLGLVGYGTGGQHFHAPFIIAAEGVELAGVVARAPGTIAKIEADLPGTPIYPSLAAMIAAGVRRWWDIPDELGQPGYGRPMVVQRQLPK